MPKISPKPKPETMYAVGYRRTDIDKPQIAIVNSWIDRPT
jgi:hypothetical protein